jgi:hypothetical protein
MPNMTLSIPTELKAKMDHYKEINWSEVARQAIREKTLILEKMNKMLSKSKLDWTDIEQHGRHIKKTILKRHKVA